MANVKIYDVKDSATDNYQILKSKDGSHFFWNDSKFQRNEPGDYIFIISRRSREALFTKMSLKGIPITYNPQTDTTKFSHNNSTYDVRGKWGDFVRFDILEKVEIPVDWNWSVQLGSSEVYDLWKEELAGQIHRADKIDDLERIFTSGEAFEILEKCRISLKGEDTTLNLIPEILDAIKTKEIQQLIELPEFVFQKGSDKLLELLQFESELNEEFYLSLEQQVKNSAKSFMEFLNSFDQNTNEYKVLKIIGGLISYCDEKAANRNIFNEYPDHRSLANSFVRQPIWVMHLLRFKSSGGNLNKITADAIRNAIHYLLNPDQELTMLSENHRKMVARYLLKTAYDKNNFVEDVKKFFESYKITPANHLNFTRIIGDILYRSPSVKKLWFEKVEGLVVSDNTKWIEEAMDDLDGKSHIVLWWDKLPTGRNKVLELLKAQLKENRFFYIFYARQGLVSYFARVVDFSLIDDYETKNWNVNNDIAWYQDQFENYQTKKEDGTIIKQARLVFLVDKIAKLTTPLPYDKFQFYHEYQPPVQNNMQPYSEVDIDVEKDKSIDIPHVVPEKRSLLPTVQDLAFGDKNRQLIMAIKTKPFVILAGISGTGKTRLVRTLANRTCALAALHNSTFNNLLVVQVKPNWHDSTELLGYESAIKNTFKITDFTRFLVRALKYPEVPFFVCLDEMNLAPVEQYFAEYLSAIESRKSENGKLYTDPIVSSNTFIKYGTDEFWKDLGIAADKKIQESLQTNGLCIPQNLVVLGTVNMDETTHSFSRKVLDRAMTIEMNQVNLREGLGTEEKDWEYEEQYYHPEQIIGQHTSASQVFTQFDESDKVISVLEEINHILDKTPFKIAYRVRDEVLIYCYHHSRVANHTDWLDSVLDEAIYMKILSRIEGDESKTKKVLDELLILSKNRSFNNCIPKLEEMKERLQYGYTNFWP